MGNLQVFGLEEYYNLRKAEDRTVGKRKEQVPVKGKTKTYYAVRYKGRKEEEGKVSEPHESYASYKLDDPKVKKVADFLMDAIDSEIEKMGVDKYNALPLEGKHEFQVKIAKEKYGQPMISAENATKIASHLEDENVHGAAGYFFDLADKAQESERGAETKETGKKFMEGGRSAKLPDSQYLREKISDRPKESMRAERELTPGEEHEKMRMRTMSDKALMTRADKIKDEVKMRRFHEKAKAMGKRDLANFIVAVAHEKGWNVGETEAPKEEAKPAGEKPKRTRKPKAEKPAEEKKAGTGSMDSDIDAAIKEFSPLYEKMTTSDLQGATEAKAMKILQAHGGQSDVKASSDMADRILEGVYASKGKEPKEKAERQLRLEEEKKPEAKIEEKPAEKVEEKKEPEKPKIPAKGEVVKPRKKETGAAEPKKVEEFVAEGGQEIFKGNLQRYFDTSAKIAEAKSTIENLVKQQEQVMSQIRPELTALDNLAKDEGKFEAKFKDEDWKYRFLSYTRTSTKWKEVAEELAKINEQAKAKIVELTNVLKQSTAQEKFERTKE